MKRYLVPFCFFVICLFHSAAFAKTPYSPYADITLNTHWDNQSQSLEPDSLLESSQTAGIKQFHLAFITDAGKCTPAWGGQSIYSIASHWASHLTDALTQQGISNVISFGGASGVDISNACSVTDMATVFEIVLSIYHPIGLDFDIENGTANVTNLMTALQQFQAHHPDTKISFTLPVLPEGLTVAGEDIVKAAKDHQLQFTVNIMAMDYGPAYTGDMGEYAIQAATNLFHFLQTLYPAKSAAEIWHLIEVTPMIGVNDVNIEFFTLNDVDLLRRFADNNNLASLSIWSISRDKPCADSWASNQCSGNNLQSQPYQFSSRFLQN